ncbi:phospholipase D family protein [Cupriavidus sp. UGS-1]|uniref:phospholipase D family protein n=1 Tax=Cupriavidus sp. UGS-1 TaxID=2899826 RepID=UPI001E2AE4C7|nr:phospholipase D family protein [Cupriavidus sp. UGS-1]MCD9123512.1 phospholipase D family protein [Cupriavidus sp. UGS-1]
MTAFAVSWGKARPRTASWLRWLAAVTLALSASACASLPQDVPRRPSTAFTGWADTPLGQVVARSTPDPALSGFHLVSSGEDAYGTLITLADRATRSLDLQYYIVAADESSREILRRVRAAAERGVHVRLLVDDLHSDGKDPAFLRFARHPNIEVRYFNPFPAGRFSKLTRFISVAGDARRVNRRMHNKVFIADNAMGMTGGRNIGNAYFLRAPDTNFLDLDVVVAGPAVRRLSAGFDEYWNSQYAYPVEALANPDEAAPGPAGTPPGSGVQAAGARGSGGLGDSKKAGGSGGSASSASAPPEQALVDEAAQREAEQKRLEASGMTAPQKIDPAKSFLARELSRGGRLNFEWARASVLVDNPAKVEPDKLPDSDDTLADEVARMMKEARQEVIIISPYLVPGKRGVEWLSALTARGVKVRVLTNSLAATDSPIVHVGYKRYRKALIRSGVELHELKPRLQRQQRSVGDFGSSQASLHVKAAVVDRQTLFVGSMNFDPRSITQNTETGLIVRNARLAGQVAQIFSDAIGVNSWRLQLSEDDELQWVDGQGKQAVVLDTEPDTTWSQRLWIDVLTPFTPEELL